MRLQITSVLEAGLLLGSGLGAAVSLGMRRVRRTPQDGAVVGHLVEG